MFKWIKKIKELENRMYDMSKDIDKYKIGHDVLEHQVYVCMTDRLKKQENVIDIQNEEIDKLKRIIRYGDRDYPRYHFEAPVVVDCKYPLKEFMAKPACIVYIYENAEEYSVELGEIYDKEVFEDTVELSFDGDLAELTLETKIDDERNWYHRFIINYKVGSYVHTEVEIPASDECGDVKEPVRP